MTTIREVMKLAIDLNTDKFPCMRVKGMSSVSFTDNEDCRIEMWFWKDRKGTPLKYALREYVTRDIEGMDTDVGSVNEVTTTFSDCHNGGYIITIRGVE